MAYNCKVDPLYYRSKYGIGGTEKELTEHFYKIGKNKGYFQNKSAEKYHRQLNAKIKNNKKLQLRYEKYINN